MTTATYAHDLDEEVNFATKTGVKKGTVKAVHVVVEAAETYPHAPVTIITYSVEVVTPGGKPPHRESVPELLVGADLEAAWAIYLDLAA